MMRALGNPRLRLFVGATMISFSPVWVKLVSVSPTTSGFYRVFFGGVALTIILLAGRQGLRLGRRVWWILAGSAVFFALDLWFWHRSINFIGPGLSTLLANFQVFFMMLAGVLLLGQKPRAVQLVAVPLALAGLGMIVAGAGALYIAGSKIENIMGWVPQAGHLGLGVSIFSYDGKVSVGVITDAGLVPDPEQITACFRARFDELLAIATAAAAD